MIIRLPKGGVKGAGEERPIPPGVKESHQRALFFLHIDRLSLSSYNGEMGIWHRLPPQRSTHLAQEYRDDLLMMHMVYMMMYGVIRREAPQLCMFDLPSPPPSLKE